MPRANNINDTVCRRKFVSNGTCLYAEDYFCLQVMPLGQRVDDLQQAPGMMSSAVSNQAGVNSSFSSTIMDETDDYMDYVGGGVSPLGLSSESSNQDRSCTSTPVGNDGSPAGENM